MGLTNQKLIVKESRRARRKAAVRFLIDSGAVYSLVPRSTLKKLGIHPYRKVDFPLSAGRTITRQLGDAYFEFQGEGGAAPVISAKKATSRFWVPRLSRASDWCSIPSSGSSSLCAWCWLDSCSDPLGRIQGEIQKLQAGRFRV